MKKFIYRIIIFVFPLFLVGICLDMFISHLLQNDHNPAGEYEVWNDIFSENLKADIAIYGSSRALVNFDSPMMTSLLQRPVYNLGMNGKNFIPQYTRHLAYSKLNPYPKYIIQSVDPITVNTKSNFNERNGFAPYMLWNYPLYQITGQKERFSKWQFMIPLLRYGGQNQLLSKAFFSPNRMPYTELGYHGVEQSWKDPYVDAKRNNEAYQISLEIDSNTILLLEEFIQEVQAQGSELLFVYTPEYIEGQTIIENKEAILAIYADFSRRYNIPMLDYRTDSISYQQDLFYNTSHLNKKGAEVFTAKLTQSLLDMKWVRPNQ